MFFILHTALAYFLHLCIRTMLMPKKIFLFFLLLTANKSFASVDSVIVPIERIYFHDRIVEEQTRLDKADGKTDQIIRVSANEAINITVTDYLFRRVNELRDSIELNTRISKNQEKVRYLRYLENLLKAFHTGWKEKTCNPAYAPILVNNFEKIMLANIDSSSMTGIIDPLPYEAARILTDIFTDNIAYWQAKKIVLFKFCSLYPDKILQQLAPFAEEPFADSLLSLSAKYNPTALYSAAQSPGSVLGKLIQRSQNPAVITIGALTNTTRALMYFPFLDDLISGKQNINSIKKYVGDNEHGYDSVGYYKLLVQTEIEYFKRIATAQPDTPIAMFGPNGLREMLQAKSIQHFINPINTLHNQANINIRMRATDPLSSVDLYFMMLMGEDEIYTSSYKHSFNRLLQRLGKNQKTDSLMVAVHFDGFKKFIKMAANFNKLDTFLKLMPPERSQLLMKAFVGNLDKAHSLEDAVDVADAYSSINNKTLQQTILHHVMDYETEAIENNKEKAKLIYGLLKQIFLSADSSNHIDLTQTIGIPSVYSIDSKTVSDDSGRIIQQVFFYGDEDGKTYFPGFIGSFSTKEWSVNIKPEWVEIKSLQGKKIWIYANRPLNNDENLDDSAILHLNQYLQQNELHPSVVVHRGHSYWFPRTLKMMPDNARIVIVGSCGGFKNINNILSFSPDAQIISTKEIGKGDINTPVLNCLNSNLLTGKPLVWKNMWNTLTKQFATADADTKASWEDYIPPYRNLGVIFIKAINKKIAGQ